MQRRRVLLKSAVALSWPFLAAPSAAVEGALRSAAGNVLVFRHALAPGTFDPPEFKLGECSTQRNLDHDGRRQARQIGAWFAQRRLRPSRVRSSPWCRCTETARLAFGEEVEAWDALGSPRARVEEVNAQALAQLRSELARAAQRRSGFEVWVTHMFVIGALAGESARSGEALLLGVQPDGALRVLERFAEFAV